MPRSTTLRKLPERWEIDAKRYFPSDVELARDVRRLLRKGTLSAQEEALARLEDRGFSAKTRFDGIHQAHTHGFSKTHENSPFKIRIPGGRASIAEFFAGTTGMNGSSRAIDLGAGYGTDAIAMARTGAKITALDSSRVAIQSLADFIQAHQNSLPHLRGISVILGDVRSEIANLVRNGPFTHVLSISSLHYYPPEVRRALLSLIRERLLETRGYLCVALKTIHSDSAQLRDNIRLTGPRHENASLHGTEGILRCFLPKRGRNLDDMLRETGFEDDQSLLGELHGFDREGKKEILRIVVARAA